MRRSQALARKNRFGPPSRVLLVVGVLLGAYLSVRLPVTITVLLMAALAAGILFYWLFVRAARTRPVGTQAAQAPMRRLAEMIRVAGVLLSAGSVWLLSLGFLTQFGFTHESGAQWSDLAAIGFRVTPEQPAAFGARCLVVATAVWALGAVMTRVSKAGVAR